MPDIAGFELAIFLAGAFTAAFVTALAGFAFGMVAAAIWLHALTPLQTTTLIVAYALLVQGYAVWKLRRSLNPGRLAPFIAGSALGIPAGIMILQWAPAAGLRSAVGMLIVLFSLYNLARPGLPEFRQAGRWLDTIVGALNGILGAATGLGGILPAIWCGMRGWSKDEQRAVFQPTAVATFLMTVIWLGGTGAVTADIGGLFGWGLPALLAGTWFGWKLYGRLDDAAFRRVVLGLLLISGIALAST